MYSDREDCGVAFSHDIYSLHNIILYEPMYRLIFKIIFGSIYEVYLFNKT